MWVLSIDRIFIIFLLLHLVLPCALFCHHVATFDLHVINNKLIREERILFILAREILNRNQHVFNLLKNLVLLINSFVYNHLIWFICCKLKSLKSSQFVNVSRRIFSNTCRIHFSCLFWTVANTLITLPTISKQDVIWDNCNFVSNNTVKVFRTCNSRVLAIFSIFRNLQHINVTTESCIQNLNFCHFNILIIVHSWNCSLIIPFDCFSCVCGCSVNNITGRCISCISRASI